MSSVLAALLERIAQCKDRVIAAEARIPPNVAAQDPFASTYYHGGEVAGLNFALAAVEELRTLVQDWVAKQGHDRCEVFEQLVIQLGIPEHSSRVLPPRAAFAAGCCQYQTEVLHGSSGNYQR